MSAHMQGRSRRRGRGAIASARVWLVQDAKARLSELLDACLRDGPQFITRRLNTVQDATPHLCAVTIGELQDGVEIVRAQDKTKADEIER